MLQLLSQLTEDKQNKLKWEEILNQNITDDQRIQVLCAAAKYVNLGQKIPEAPDLSNLPITEINNFEAVKKVEHDFPFVARAHLEISKYYRLTGKLNNALTSINIANLLSPEDLRITSHKFQVYLDLNETQDAVDLLKTYPRYSHEFVADSIKMIWRLKKLNQIETAFDLSLIALRMHPNDYDLIMEVAILNEERQKLSASLTGFKKSAIMMPNEIRPILGMLKVLDASEGHKSMRKILDASKPKWPNSVDLLNFEGNVYLASGDTDEAASVYQKILNLDPKNDLAMHNLGVLHYTKGELKEAKTYLNRILKLKPYNIDVIRFLVMIEKDITITHELYKQLKLALSKHENQNLKSQMLGYYTLFEIKNNSKKYDGAFKDLRKANIKRLTWRPDLSEAPTTKYIQRMLKSYKQEQSPRIMDNQNINPILIVGLPRSGTSLMEQILTTADEVQGAGELNTLHRALVKHQLMEIDILTTENLTLLRHEYLEDIRQIAKDKKFVVDKMPTNFLYVGQFLQAFPEGNVVWMFRDVRALAWSNYRTYFTSTGNGFSYDLDKIFEMISKSQMLYEKFKKCHEKQIYGVVYEDLIADPKIMTQKISEFIGISWSETMLRPGENKRQVKTASALQVREGIYKRPNLEWENYKEYLTEPYERYLNRVVEL